MSERVKIFWSFDELERDEKNSKINFLELNNFLEKNTDITIDDVNNSYLKVFLDEDFQNNRLDYSELDFIVKKLIEESWEAVNAILWFIDFKYPKKQELIKDTFRKYFIIQDDAIDYIVNTIMNEKIWYLGFWNEQIYFDFQNFEFLEALRRLNSRLEQQIKG